MPLTNDQITAIQMNLCIGDDIKTKLIRDWDTFSPKQQEAALRLVDIAKHMQKAVIAKVVEKNPEFEQQYDVAIEQGLQGISKQREQDQETADAAAFENLSKSL